MPHYNSLRDLRTKYLVKTMSEQSNKPSPDAARAASSPSESNPPRERAGGELRAPMTQTPDGRLQTKGERRHAGEGGARGSQGEGRAQRAPRPQNERGAQGKP
ncbi:MAG TPA: hypothetical protein DDX04_01480, partial [Massilia sp.]|nr:hypothetical protein [Massilia sp.]